MDLNILNNTLDKVKESNFFIKYTQGINSFQLFEHDYHLYYSNKKKGIEFIFIDERLSSIHFFGIGHKEYHIFEDKLPFDINILDTKLIVYKKFGNVEFKSGGGEIIPILGRNNYWSIFKIDNIYIRFEFLVEKIALITMTKKTY